MHDPTTLPSDLPAPQDDGATAHLTGMRLPPLSLISTRGTPQILSEINGKSVLFFYPRSGVPGRPPPDGWDLVPGARGCTPHSCAYRDLASEFAALGVSIYGISTQTTDYQREFAERTHLTFELLSDSDLALTRAMRLPTMEMPPISDGLPAGGPSTLIKRMSWYCEGGVIRKVWYPVFPPDQNASVVLTWLKSLPISTARQTQ
ncbi:MAG: peroxiredoxin [Planctomycetes bacterium]|nr:peroxiredoxin [Planctomycetota bacterium]